MTNWDFYKEMIEKKYGVDNFAINATTGKVCFCAAISCRGCIFATPNESCVNQHCDIKKVDWLVKEYEGPKIDWSRVRPDTKILVKEYDYEEWSNKYFARYDAESDIVFAYTGGATSWSAHGETAWEFAKLASDEEEENYGHITNTDK